MIRHVFKKVGMTSSFDENGFAKGVTILKHCPGKVLRHEKTEDGRSVLVIEYDIGTKKSLVRGWLVDNINDYKVGSLVSDFEPKVGDKLKITGTSKGRGFQHAMTRHGFGGGPASHGSRFHRSPGSAGMRTEPGRTPKGHKMPGQFGNVKVTVKNVKVMYWSKDDAVLGVLGGVPGARNGCVFV